MTSHYPPRGYNHSDTRHEDSGQQHLEGNVSRSATPFYEDAAVAAAAASVFVTNTVKEDKWDDTRNIPENSVTLDSKQFLNTSGCGISETALEPLPMLHIPIRDIRKIPLNAHGNVYRKHNDNHEDLRIHQKNVHQMDEREADGKEVTRLEVRKPNLHNYGTRQCIRQSRDAEADHVEGREDSMSTKVNSKPEPSKVITYDNGDDIQYLSTDNDADIQDLIANGETNQRPAPLRNEESFKDYSQTASQSTTKLNDDLPEHERKDPPETRTDTLQITNEMESLQDVAESYDSPDARLEFGLCEIGFQNRINTGTRGLADANPTNGIDASDCLGVVEGLDRDTDMHTESQNTGKISQEPYASNENHQSMPIGESPSTQCTPAREIVLYTKISTATEQENIPHDRKDVESLQEKEGTLSKTVQRPSRRCGPCLYPWRKRSTRRMYVMSMALMFFVAIGIIKNHTEVGNMTTACSEDSDETADCLQASNEKVEEVLQEKTGKLTYVSNREKRLAAKAHKRSSKGVTDGASNTTFSMTTTEDPSGTTMKKKKKCKAVHKNDHFPDDFLGFVKEPFGSVCHLLISFYMFGAVAAVCDVYFVPALEHICEDLGLQADVAGATFMAAASSAPEFCTSVIGVFLAKSDVGLSAIVGSSIFNLLAIIGACALFAGMDVQLSWYPLTRDSIFYLLSIVEMVIFMSDSVIRSYEAGIMISTYGIYIIVMIVNTRIEKWANNTMNKIRPSQPAGLDSRRSSAVLQMVDARRKKSRINQNEAFTKSGLQELQKLGITGQEAERRLSFRGSGVEGQLPSIGQIQDPAKTPKTSTAEPARALGSTANPQTSEDSQLEREASSASAASSQFKVVEPEQESDDKDRVEVSAYENPLEIPETFWPRCYWFLMLPATLIHIVTIPDSRKLGTWQAKAYMLSFMCSVAYIGLYSYIMVWMVTLSSYEWGIPDTIVGLTILAAGTSVPDCLASVFVARDGYGDMAVSNAIGSNVFDILLCLGVPWLVEDIIGSSNGVSIDSSGMLYVSFSLLGTIIYLWSSLHFVGWTLTKTYGVVTMVVYTCVMTMCILLELNVLFKFHDCED